MLARRAVSQESKLWRRGEIALQAEICDGRPRASTADVGHSGGEKSCEEKLGVKIIPESLHPIGLCILVTGTILCFSSFLL